LVFSHSRQTAARLAPNLQNYSNRDVLKPLLVAGFAKLEQTPGLRRFLSLDDSYLAVLVASKLLGARLRPELRQEETFADLIVSQAIDNAALETQADAFELLLTIRSASPPVALLQDIHQVITDGFIGLYPLALASVREREGHAKQVSQFPDIGGIAESPDEKTWLARQWLAMWLRHGIWLSRMPSDWAGREVRLHSGNFSTVKKVFSDKSSALKFQKEWLPQLMGVFAEQIAGPTKQRIKGSELTLELGGKWQYCQVCKSVQRPAPIRNRCIRCQSGLVVDINPDSEPVFVARKGYYRQPAIQALQPSPVTPMAIVAAEHTAQIGTAQEHQVYSLAEEHELLFQDVNLGVDDKGRQRPAIDVLSCTTTMEVGIDIGALSGVALRNMPPARANYQQRAGRAGRRGNTIATVIALAGADSHDSHFFEEPHDLVRGQVRDPVLVLDNDDIARRHVTAFLLQSYLAERLPNIAPDAQPQLFEVLGSVSEFLDDGSTLNRNDFAKWLNSNQSRLVAEVDTWIPAQIATTARSELLSHLVEDTLAAIDSAVLISR
jgi:hypothetical protein